MNAEFQWWLLILGIVIGGALVYLVMADLRSDEGPEGTGEYLGDEDQDPDDEDEILDDDDRPIDDDDRLIE